MYQSIIFLAAAATVFLTLFFTRKWKNAFYTVLKVLSIALYTLVLVKQFLADSFPVSIVNGGWVGESYLETTDHLQTILRFGYNICYAVIPMAVFTRSRLFRNIAGYVALPFAVLSAVFFDDFMKYFLDDNPYSAAYDLPGNLRHVLFIAELVLAIAIPIALHIRERHVFNVKSLTEWKNFIVALPLVLLTTMPAYVPQAIVGSGLKTPTIGSSYHIIWILITFVIVMALYYALRFKSYEDRYNVCLFLTLALFVHCNAIYVMGVTLKRLPFQLCNIAGYFYIIAIIFKLEKMFHFCFLANTVGTVFAIVAPDLGVGNFGFWNIHFLWEHTLVLLIPALAMGLRIFKRVSYKSLKYYMVGFTIYFLFSFITGTIINGFTENMVDRVNYFYMFDLNTAYRYFPFLAFTEDYCYTFSAFGGTFEIYPLVVSFVYVGFTLLNLIFFFAVKYFYKLEDDHLRLRASSIDLYEKITNKESRRPKTFID